ncbi:MAG: hypothetical protein ABI347_05345 [Nitrososphaera sp.]
MMRAYIIAIVAMLVATPLLAQQAFAHAHTELAVSQDAVVAGKKIRVVVGHTSEPTYGAKPGIHDGKHNLEVLLSDSETGLPLTGAMLKADRYYFKDLRSFNKAKSVADADSVAKGTTIGAVFGDAGHYMARQVQKAGIYGYRIYGNVSYFGVASVPIDSVVFCKSNDGNTTKFNSPGWSGGFGCTQDINSIAFPPEAEVKKAVAYEGAQPPVVASSAPLAGKQTDLGLWLGLPAAATAAAGVFVWRGKKKDEG